VYVYTTSREFRELTYYVNPIRTVVLKAGEISSLRVLYRNGEIQSDITAAQVAIWNRGKQPIAASDVLTPVRIIAKPRVHILEAVIAKISRRDIKFAIDVSQLAEGAIPLAWKILERDDGALIQLIYAGGPDTAIGVEGVIVGQPTIAALRFGGKIKSPSEQLDEISRDNRNGGYFFLFLAVVSTALFAPEILSRRRRNIPMPGVLRVVLIIILSLLGFAIYLIRSSGIPGPPFGL
jgi:hypothetical protein